MELLQNRTIIQIHMKSPKVSCTNLPLVHEVEEEPEVVRFDVPQKDDWVGVVVEDATHHGAVAGTRTTRVATVHHVAVTTGAAAATASQGAGTGPEELPKDARAGRQDQLVGADRLTFADHGRVQEVALIAELGERRCHAGKKELQLYITFNVTISKEPLQCCSVFTLPVRHPSVQWPVVLS